MTTEPTAHIEPSAHSTPQVDTFLQHVEGRVDTTAGAGSPAIKPNKDLADNGKPNSDTPENPKM